MNIKAITITGDSGKDYQITTDGNGSLHCTCPSFKYQTKFCKHLAYVVAKIK